MTTEADDGGTERQRLAEARTVAAEALKAYRFRPTRISVMGRHSNTWFRVEASGKRRFALRVGSKGPRFHVRTEAAWLERLAGDNEASTAKPIRNRNDKSVTDVRIPGVSGVRSCVLFEWLPGRPVGDVAGPLDYELLGELSATLHEQAARWKRRTGLRPLVWNRAFYFPDERSALSLARARSLVTPPRAARIKRVTDRLTPELRRLHRGDTHLLHGGLTPDNVHLFSGRLHAFDFEEVTLGAAVQDIAITLWQARRERDYLDKLTGFFDGYHSVRDWPVEHEGQVNLLMVGRSLVVLNSALRAGTATEDDVIAFIEEAEAVL
jgi:Ser/Thr protein kinase RdoA (MazF antagonist)